jgi:hypothetical protein
MNFLRIADYYSQIESDNLQEVIDTTDTYRTDAENKAQEELSSYLRQRYDIQRVMLPMTVFSGSNSYLLTQRTIYTIASVDYIYYAIPAPNYDPTVSYILKNRVLYLGSVYECVLASVTFLPTNTIYFKLIDLVANVLTNAPGSLPTDITNWALGDNRNPALVMYMVDMILYHLHARINPRNIPELRMIRYDGNSPQQNGGAIGWLKSVAKGFLMPDLPLLAPDQGNSIVWGSGTKQAHYY